MADPRHLSLLRDSFEEFNQWRAANPDQPVELSNANLFEADLFEADLSGADLRGADLSGADLGIAGLRGANLRGADLSGADLSGADLSEADLGAANLTDANLNKANLNKAILSGADLSMANLSGARLTEANLRGADLAATNLSGANLVAAKLEGTNLTTAEWSSEDPPKWREGLEQVRSSRRPQEVPPAPTPPAPATPFVTPVTMRVSVDVSSDPTPMEMAKHVADLSDVAALVEGLLPAFTDSSGRTGEPVGGAPAAPTGSDLPPFFVVRGMRYGNPLTIDLAFTLSPESAAAPVAAFMASLATLMEVTDWLDRCRERWAAQKADTRAGVARAEPDEARAQAELAMLRQASGAPLDSLPSRATRALRLIVDNKIEIDPAGGVDRFWITVMDHHGS